jgi:hypothetical protein
MAIPKMIQARSGQTQLHHGVETGVLLTMRSPDSRCTPDQPSRRKPLAYCR